MKIRVVLFLCLIALLACHCDTVETIKCLLHNKDVIDLGIKIIKLVLNRDFSKIVNTIVDALPVLKKAYLECKAENSEEINLKEGLECRDWGGYIWCCIFTPDSWTSCYNCYNTNCL